MIGCHTEADPVGSIESMTWHVDRAWPTKDTIVGALLAIVACGCVDHPTLTSPSHGVVVRGQVLDFRTRAGISGAVVQFDRQSPQNDVFQMQVATDANGAYVASLPELTGFDITVNNRFVAAARTGLAYRGELFLELGTCVARYGVIVDAATMRPVAGATVAIHGSGIDATAVTAADGWYWIDFGCPSSGTIGFNTTFMDVTHRDYARASASVGRGIQRVYRVDFDLGR